MTNDMLEVYRALCGKTDVPQEVIDIHDRVDAVLSNIGRHASCLSPDTMALIVVLSNGDEPKVGCSVRVGGQFGTYAGRAGGNCVRVKFPEDDKQFRIIPEEDVVYE